MIECERATVEGQQRHDGAEFPLVYRCQTAESSLGDACEWAASRRDDLCRQAGEHGAVLFRGFSLAAAEDFDRFIAAFELPNFRYEDSLSNAVRVVRTPRVFTANEAPPNVNIFFHHEMAQTPVFPSKLFFFGEQPSESGGATPLCRSDVLWERLAHRCPQFAADCVAKGLRYTNVMPAANDPNSGMGRSWQSTLRSETREEGEDRLRGLGYSWQWQDDGCLRATTPVLPAVRDLSNGRRSFFNQLIAAFKGWKDERNDPSQAITFGDGAPLDRAAAATAVELADELAFDLMWQRGDVALVDNFVTMHGRRTFTGARKILASLVA